MADSPDIIHYGSGLALSTEEVHGTKVEFRRDPTNGQWTANFAPPSNWPSIIAALWGTNPFHQPSHRSEDDGTLTVIAPTYETAVSTATRILRFD